MGCSVNISTAKEAHFVFDLDLLRTQPQWFALYQRRVEKGYSILSFCLMSSDAKEHNYQGQSVKQACLGYKRKRLIRDVFYTFATPAGPLCDVTDTDCWAQNGSTHGSILPTFRRGFLSNWTND